ncbi:MAG: VanZ family protein [Bryobacterales bacterium]|nr:VanZ family protein [Bryobacterales bacterium]
MFHFSTAGFSSDTSRSALLKILGWLGIRFADGTLGALNSLFRSAAHIVEYSVLSLLLYRCLAGSRGFQWHQRTVRWCAGIAATFALTDELHQALVPNRGSSLLDCVIDGAGIALGMLCIKGLNNRRESNHSRASEGTSVPDRRL